MEGMNLRTVVRTNPNKVQNKKLKNEGYLLGNISARGAKSIAVAVKKDEFKRALKLNKDRMFTLTSDDVTYEVRLKELQIAHVEVDLGHVDFQLV